jgi:hypothetical protein
VCRFSAGHQVTAHRSISRYGIVKRASVAPMPGRATTSNDNRSSPLRYLGGALRSVFHHVIAHRFPAKNKIAFLTASRGLSSGTIMGMDVGGAMGNGVINAHMALQPLMHATGLCNIDRNPAPILALHRVNKVAGQRLEGSVNGIDLILILRSRLAGPIDAIRRCALRFPTVIE